jgi:hypothetical protein
MSTSACADLNVFAVNAADSKILPSGQTCWGVLGQLESFEPGLIRAHGVTDFLIDDSLQQILSGLVGRKVIIGHIAGKWQAGAISE